MHERVYELVEVVMCLLEQDPRPLARFHKGEMAAG